MFTLFLRTLSQGLQAFIPIAAAWTWFRRSGFTSASRSAASRAAAALRAGALAALPLTVVASRLFAATTHKALDEFVLALVALAAATGFLRAEWERLSRAGRPVLVATAHPDTSSTVVVALATVLVIVRQTMEIGATFSAAFFDMRSLEATVAVSGGGLLALLVGMLWTVLGARVSNVQLARATRVCTVLFLLQVVVYSVHESFEARIWPLSEDVSAMVHEASEPYGPDGIYGMHFSELLVLGPLAAVAVAHRGLRRAARVVATVVMPLGVGLTATLGGMAVSLAIALVALAMPIGGHSAATDALTAMKQPFVLFRDTTPGTSFGQATVVPLAAPAGERAAAGITCERVSFAPLLGTGSRGLCLHAAPRLFNLFTGYSAIFLDAALKDRALAMKLDGKPSRTRISPDGRVGAFTVFVFGDGYTSVDFSTRTLLVDMATGGRIADLEEFSTTRNGERFNARDFNFWGVTFARDGDTFYASLRTAGKTYLVRGSLAKRQFTVLRDNLECPSLAPDGRRLAFKKFIGPDPGAWRIATLDLATLQERLVAGETRYVDDQVEWLDDGHLLYGIPRRTTESADVWTVTIDGDAPASIFIPLAESPIVVR